MKLRAHNFSFPAILVGLTLMFGCTGSPTSDPSPNTIPMLLAAVPGSAAATTAEQSKGRIPARAIITQAWWIGYWTTPAKGEDLCRESPVIFVAYGKNCKTRITWTPGPKKDWWPVDWKSQSPAPEFTHTEASQWPKLLGVLGLPLEGICEVVQATGFTSGGYYYPWSGQGTLTYTVRSQGQKVVEERKITGCKG